MDVRVLVVHNDLEHRGAEFLSEDLGFGGTWLQTSYNGNFRKNYAGYGFTYDPVRDAFIPPKPDNSIGFDEDTCTWITPEVDIEALVK